jgi:hypothetical protein
VEATLLPVLGMLFVAIPATVHVLALPVESHRRGRAGGLRPVPVAVPVEGRRSMRAARREPSGAPSTTGG